MSFDADAFSNDAFSDGAFDLVTPTCSFEGAAFAIGAFSDDAFFLCSAAVASAQRIRVKARHRVVEIEGRDRRVLNASYHVPRIITVSGNTLIISQSGVEIITQAGESLIKQ